jgi:hypothetical protein
MLGFLGAGGVPFDHAILPLVDDRADMQRAVGAAPTKGSVR